MLFSIALLGTALLGGCIAALLSQLPGRRRNFLAAWLLLTPLAAGIFVAGLCVWTQSWNLHAVWNRFFPDRLSKLIGCGMLLLLCAVIGLLAAFLRAGGPSRYFRLTQNSRLHRLLAWSILGCGTVLCFGCVMLAGAPALSPVRLNEICCCNFSLLVDPVTEEHSAYIELVNNGSEPVDLRNYYLSDNAKKRTRFCLPALTLDPGACVVLWADGAGKSGQLTDGSIHLNFSLQPGETVWFSSPHGVLLDHVTAPERYKNISLSRLGDEWIYAEGTPGRANDGARRFTPPTLNAPVFSLASGFYDDPQTLTITVPEGCTVRYTLDGSVPTEESLLYTEPMTLTDISDQPNQFLNHPTTTFDRSGVVTEPVDKGTVIRAASFDGSGARSETVTAVYFVGKERFEKYRNTRILNIVAAPDDLFGNYGIAVTGLDYDRWLENGGVGNSPFPFFYRNGRLLEVDAEAFLWDPDFQLLMDEPCGLRLQGDSSRARAFKRFRLIARNIYHGSNVFSVPLFGDNLSHTFFMRVDTTDLVAQQLCEGLDLGGLDAVHSVIFCNGEFYTTTYLRERYDRQYFANHYGLDPDDLVMIQNDTLGKGKKADYEDYRAFMDYISEHDCADPAVYASICAQMDVKNYAQYVAVNLYCNNTDWSIYKNYKMWRSRSGTGEGVLDGRWRWLLYDMDACCWCLDSYKDKSRSSYDIFTYPAPYTNEPFLEMPVFRDLMHNPEFRLLFAQAWLELMNFTLTPARAQTVLEHYDITGDPFWIRFLTKRLEYAPGILLRELELEGAECTLKLRTSDSAGGSVRVNGFLPAFSGDSWEGSWITGIPLTLTAEPSDGWRFVRWEGRAAGTDATLTQTPTGDTDLIAVFERLP